VTRTLRLTTFSRTSVLLAAQHRGFLEEQGLALDVEDAKGSRPQMEGMLAGRWDLAHTNADNVMKFRVNGFEDLFLFLVVDRGIAQKLIVHPDVTSFEDLRGRPVGVDAPDSGYAFVLYELLGRHGLRAGDYEVVPLGATAFRLKGLQDGSIVAGLLSHHHETRALDEGFTILADTRDEFPTHAGVTAGATRSWARDNGDALVGYTTALLAAARWAYDPANWDEVVAVVAQGRGIDLDAARRLLEVETEGRTGVIGSVADVEESLAASAELRARYTGATPTGYFDPAAMQAAFAALPTAATPPAALHTTGR
jgi:ABC-type nitrate/sulfonate/bicarbonate transport system substrate-binding protein